MGAFAEALEIFAAQGIGVIPTRHERPSMPMVKHPDLFGVQASLKLGRNPRFDAANAGVWTGPRSSLTIVDVDSVDPMHAADAIRIFGDTPLKVSTPSGGLHLYYRHTGERRCIRPFGKDLPLDVLGSGLAVVPPSRRPAGGTKAPGVYEVLEGHLGSLDRLPKISSGAMPHRRDQPQPAPLGVQQEFGALRDGDGRDVRLFDMARSLATSCATEAELVNLLMRENSTMAEPLAAVAVRTKAASVWRYKVQGRLMASGSRAALMDLNTIRRCSGHPVAFLLLAYLRSHHSHAHQFAVVPEAVAPMLGQSHNTVRRAREQLVGAGFLELVRRGGGGKASGGGRPSVYRLIGPGHPPQTGGNRTYTAPAPACSLRDLQEAHDV